MIATCLGEITSGDDAELGGESLKEDRHEVGDEDDAEQRVAESRSTGEVGGPVAGIHVADGDEIAGAGEGEDLPPGGAGPDGDASVDLGEAGGDAGSAPAGLPLV